MSVLVCVCARACMCACACACVCCACVCVYKGRYGTYIIFYSFEVHQFYLYSAHANVLQQLCDVRLYVDRIKIHKFPLVFFHAEITGAQLCVLNKMHFSVPSPFFSPHILDCVF